MNREQISAAYRDWSRVIEKLVCWVMRACKSTSELGQKVDVEVSLDGGFELAAHFVAVRKVELVVDGI